MAICYEVGDATGLGKSVISECKNYDGIIGNSHIKDKEICGNMIFESYYGERTVDDTISNFEYIKNMMGERA